MIPGSQPRLAKLGELVLAVAVVAAVHRRYSAAALKRLPSPVHLVVQSQRLFVSLTLASVSLEIRRRMLGILLRVFAECTFVKPEEVVMH